MKVNTISLNSVRLNTIALNHIGEIRSGGGGSKPSPIPQWIREHISFYYDMSKPMDVYHTNFTKWLKGPIGNAIGKQTENEIILNGRRNEGDTTLGYLVRDKSLFLTKGDLIKIEGASNEAKIKVVVQKNNNQWVNAFNGTDEIVSDGIYEFSLTPINYKGIQIEITGVTTYSNLKITILPSGKSVPANEILKVSGYLQDLSGRKRNMKLNNFLFAEMSGVGGYNDNFSNWRTDSNNGAVKIESDSSIVIQSVKIEYRGVLYQDSAKKATLKCNITGITEELKGKLIFRYTDAEGSKNITLENGYFELNSSEYEGLSGWYGFTSKQPIDNCNITITQIPEYPGALVTDGVDDYGLVENLSSGVKMLFMTVNPMSANKILYAQRKQSTTTYPFAIYNGSEVIAYNYMNPNGATYIDGILNKSAKPNVLIGTKHVVTIVNDGVDSNNSKTPMFFNEQFANYYAKLAFYNSIAFDSIPTEADGFTEQELIDYVLTNIIGQ